MPFIDYGAIFGKLSSRQKKEVIDRVVEDALNHFHAYLKALDNAFDFRSLSPQERLILYSTRTEEEWQMLEEQDPEEYEQALKDWQQLYGRLPE